MTTNKDLKYYMGLPYPVEVIPPDGDETRWYARIPLLRGCGTTADTWNELQQQIDDAKETWLESALEFAMTIPEPEPIRS